MDYAGSLPTPAKISNRLPRRARRKCRPGRFGTPEEFGKACAFLCSADASFIVGQNLMMAGQ